MAEARQGNLPSQLSLLKEGKGKMARIILIVIELVIIGLMSLVVLVVYPPAAGLCWAGGSAGVLFTNIILEIASKR